MVDVDGEWWLFYHAWRNGKMNSQPGRLMLMDRVEWEEGWPVVGVPSDRPRPGPSVRRRRWRPGRRHNSRNMIFSTPQRGPTLRLRRN